MSDDDHFIKLRGKFLFVECGCLRKLIEAGVFFLFDLYMYLYLGIVTGENEFYDFVAS